MYCPNCGHSKLNQFPANLPVADFFCAVCNDQFELKSQKKSFGKVIANGAYAKKIERLESNTSLNLILINYSQTEKSVRDILLIPKRFFVPSIIQRRQPLRMTARRAGWVGSNIMIGKVPDSGRIFMCESGSLLPKEIVLEQWRKTAFLNNLNLTAKGWLIEVMNCVDQLDRNGFTLDDVYRFEATLSRLYPDNKNVRPKIRQQLQVLRDNGYLEFLGGGRYRISE